MRYERFLDRCSNRFVAEIKTLITKNIARIAKAVSHKLPGKSSLNASFALSCPVLSCPVLTTMIIIFTTTTMTNMTTMITMTMVTMMTMATMRKLEVI